MTMTIPGNNQRNNGHLLNQSRATNTTTGNNYKNISRLTKDTLRNTDQNQETDTNAGRAKNIAEWRALFTKAREQIPKPQKQISPRMDSRIQPTIMPINGNEAFGDTMDKTNQGNNFRINFQNVNDLAVGKELASGKT